MELNIPKKTDEEYPEYEWLNQQEIPVGESMKLRINRVHIGEKAVCFFDEEQSQAIALFHTSDYEGETLGERALVSLGQSLEMVGKKIDADKIVKAANDHEGCHVMRITHASFEKDGEEHTFKRISFKQE